MRRSWSQARARLFAAEAAGATRAPAGRGAILVGRDFAAAHRHRPRRRPGRAVALPLLVGAVCAALGLAALRVSILRVRYQLAAALTEETQLLERKRAATVELRRLRDPVRLHREAKRLGFARPERVVEIPLPASRP